MITFLIDFRLLSDFDPIIFLDLRKIIFFFVKTNTGKSVEALKIVLENAPLSSRNQQVKDNALTLILRVILSIKSQQINTAVDTLAEQDLLDTLMKYIYRGFEIPSEGSSGQLLQWHEKVTMRNYIFPFPNR